MVGKATKLQACEMNARGVNLPYPPRRDERGDAAARAHRATQMRHKRGKQRHGGTSKRQARGRSRRQPRALPPPARR
eukprot:14714492-Alexandrium_andersonii.AAC.1